MNTDVREELRQFSVRLLERRGGMVEWPGADQIGEAIVPADVAAAFGAQGEFVTLACTPGGAVVGVSLANDFLDAAARVLDAEPRVADFSAADLYLKRKDIDAALAKTFTWLNAKVRIQGACEAREEYHFWWFHAVVRSEDRWETRFHVAINSQCGTALALPDPMGLWELRPSPDESRRPPSATFPFAAADARREVLRLAEPFLQRKDDGTRPALRHRRGTARRGAGQTRAAGVARRSVRGPQTGSAAASGLLESFAQGLRADRVRPVRRRGLRCGLHQWKRRASLRRLRQVVESGRRTFGPPARPATPAVGISGDFERGRAELPPRRFGAKLAVLTISRSPDATPR